MAASAKSGSSGLGAPVILMLAVLGVGAITMIGGRFAGDPGPDLTKLVATTTKTRTPEAPRDKFPQQATDGTVAHPTEPLAVYDQPAGQPFAKVTPKQFGPTWLPVIDRSDRWLQVLLPSRPNGAVGWIEAEQVELRSTDHLVRVHLGSRTLEVIRGGQSVGTWSVAIGADATPTPTGRTFILGSIEDEQQPFSPIILPLGSHSNTLDSYGGGPGTVALHGWPDSSIFGDAVSHGCVRVPDEALDVLTQAPLGSLVIVDRQ